MYPCHRVYTQLQLNKYHNIINSPRYSLYQRLCWTQGRSGKLGEEKNVLPWPDSVLSKLQIGTVPLCDLCHGRGPESMWLLLVRYRAIIKTKWYRSMSPSFINSIGMCRMRRFLVILSNFFHSSLLCTFSCHPSPPTILPSSLTSSCHLFLGLPLNLIVPKFIYNTLLGILFSPTLCTCPNQRNLFNLTLSITVSFF